MEIQMDIPCPTLTSEERSRHHAYSEWANQRFAVGADAAALRKHSA